jgi:hypothetical protein
LWGEKEDIYRPTEIHVQEKQGVMEVGLYHNILTNKEGLLDFVTSVYYTLYGHVTAGGHK